MNNNQNIYGYTATKLVKVDGAYVPSDMEIRINASGESEAKGILVDIFPDEVFTVSLQSLKAWDTFALSREYFDKVKIFLKENYKSERFCNEKGFNSDREDRKTIDAVKELLDFGESIITYHSSNNGREIKFDKDLNIINK